MCWTGGKGQRVCCVGGTSQNGIDSHFQTLPTNTERTVLFPKARKTNNNNSNYFLKWRLPIIPLLQVFPKGGT